MNRQVNEISALARTVTERFTNDYGPKRKKYLYKQEDHTELMLLLLNR